MREREKKKKKKRRGLKTQNALTSETQVSVCLYHGVLPLYRFVHTHTPVHQHTHTLFALEDDPRRPHQERRTPSKELLTPSHPSPSAPLPPPDFPKVPSLRPVQPT